MLLSIIYEDTVDIIEKCDHEEGSGVKGLLISHFTATCIQNVYYIARRRRKVGDKNSHQEVWQRLEELEKEENEFLRKEAGKEDEGREGEEKVKLPLYVIIPVQHTNTGGKDNEDIKRESLIQKTVPYYRTPADIVCKSRVNIRNGSGDVSKEAVLHAKKHVSWNPKLENADSIIKQSSLNQESEMPKVTLNPVKTSQLHSLVCVNVVYLHVCGLLQEHLLLFLQPFSDYVVERSFIQSEVTSDDQKQVQTCNCSTVTCLLYNTAVYMSCIVPTLFSCAPMHKGLRIWSRLYVCVCDYVCVCNQTNICLHAYWSNVSAKRMHTARLSTLYVARDVS